MAQDPLRFCQPPLIFYPVPTTYVSMVSQGRGAFQGPVRTRHGDNDDDDDDGSVYGGSGLGP